MLLVVAEPDNTAKRNVETIYDYVGYIIETNTIMVKSENEMNQVNCFRIQPL